MVRHNQSCKACKQRLLSLLSEVCGGVEEQYALDLPASLDDYRHEACFEALKSIHEGLQNFRGYQSFVRTSKLPKVDYYLPASRTVVEFDESQHFTRPRGISLGRYPKEMALGYALDEWIGLSRQLDRRDIDPPYRDEQRAWYDTLRDFSAQLLGNRPTVRLYAGSAKWCSLDAEDPNSLAFVHTLIHGEQETTRIGVSVVSIA